MTISDFERDLRSIARNLCGDCDLAARLEDSTADFAVLLDQLADFDTKSYERFRQEAETYLREIKPSFLVEKLARVSWSVVFSLSLDLQFEAAVRAHLSSKPTSRKPTVITAPSVLGNPALQLPLFKLLGSSVEVSEGSRVALSKSERLIKRSEWSRLVNGSIDYLRDSALVFFGVAEQKSLVQDLVSTLYSGHAPYPGLLLFFEGDDTGRDSVIDRIVKDHGTIRHVCGTEQQLLEAMLSPAGSQQGLKLELNLEQKDGDWTKFKGLVHVVSGEKPTYQLGNRRQEVLEGLFRPNGMRWDCFRFDLDLARSQSTDLLQALQVLYKVPERRPKFLVFRGEAGVGKTVVAKRLATDLARMGNLVLWVKKTNGELFHLYRELAKDLRSFATRNPNSGVFMVWDDPWAIGVAPVEFAAALDSEGVDITIVIVMRNSDKASARGASRLPPVDEEIELAYELTPSEEAELPHFLLKVGAARDLADARGLLVGASGRSAKDILCRLWYLLPDTREQLEKSLSDEYFRLENVDRLIGTLAESAEASGATARRAYEAVAVASGLGIGVPTEVLVNAIRINYSDWVAICSGGRPLWGLLYPVEHQEDDQFWYFTRNEVVTQILLKQINGGVGHAAEVRVLRQLVEACSGTSPAYRDFLIELLIRNKDKLRKVVSPREGRDLYELALKTFPVPDRALLHHFAKWVADEEQDNKEAYEILQRALDTPDYPYASHEERREFIHTSMAAVIVQRVKRDEQDRESGLVAVKRHLREASTPAFFNLYTVHVQVNALIRLQQGDDPVSMDCFVEACRALERAQQLAGTQGRRQLRYREALDLLENQKKDLASTMAPFAKLREEALRKFDESGDQLHTEAAALKGLIEASLVDKGSAYNGVFQFLRQCQEHVLKKRQSLSIGLRQTRIDLIVRWRLQHEIGEVDWNLFLGDVRVVREAPARRDDVLLLFYEGVACFHLRLAAEAQAAFHRLRTMDIPGSLVGQPRVYLRSKSGHPEQIQGVLIKGGARARVRLSEYGYDAPLYKDRMPANGQNGALVHCYLSFSLQGPLAEFQAHDSSDFLLPN
ncbi:MAG: hypothetical protein ACK5TK_09530 [Betaproteobacteria bacterium]